MPWQRAMGERQFHYGRCAFAARMDANRLYTPGHSWLSRQEETLWRVGFTAFAIRLIGEPVEFGFKVETGAQVEVGQVIGWIEGFKAVTDLFSSLNGRFLGANPELFDNIDLIESDPQGRGWLYAVEGTPGDECFDVDGYASFLDTTIDKMMGQSRDRK